MSGTARGGGRIPEQPACPREGLETGSGRGQGQNPGLTVSAQHFVPMGQRKGIGGSVSGPVIGADDPQGGTRESDLSPMRNWD